VVRNRAPGGNIHDVGSRGLRGVAAVSGDGLIGDEPGVSDREETLTSAVDGAAVGYAERSASTIQAAAVGAESLVAEERAADNRGTRPDTPIIGNPDSAPLDVAVPTRTYGPVGDEGAGQDVEHTTLDTGDGAAVLRLIGGKDVVGEVD